MVGAADSHSWPLSTVAALPSPGPLTLVAALLGHLLRRCAPCPRTPRGGVLGCPPATPSLRFAPSRTPPVDAAYQPLSQSTALPIPHEDSSARPPRTLGASRAGSTSSQCGCALASRSPKGGTINRHPVIHQAMSPSQAVTRLSPTGHFAQPRTSHPPDPYPGRQWATTRPENGTRDGNHFGNDFCNHSSGGIAPRAASWKRRNRMVRCGRTS